MTQTDPMGMIPTWIVNKATKTFAPKLLDNLIRVGPKYPEWKAANSPNTKPWLAIGEKYWWEASGADSPKTKSSRSKLAVPDSKSPRKSPKKSPRRGKKRGDDDKSAGDSERSKSHDEK